jgi:hypothetical protein
VDFLVGFLGLDDGLIYIYREDRTKLDGHVTFFLTSDRLCWLHLHCLLHGKNEADMWARLTLRYVVRMVPVLSTHASSFLSLSVLASLSTDSGMHSSQEKETQFPLHSLSPLDLEAGEGTKATIASSPLPPTSHSMLDGLPRRYPLSWPMAALGPPSPPASRRMLSGRAAS